MQDNVYHILEKQAISRTKNWGYEDSKSSRR